MKVDTAIVERLAAAISKARSGRSGASYLDPVPTMRDEAAPPVAPLRRRKWRLGMLLAVLLPSLLGATYLWGFAADQYVSEFRFSVRREAPVSTSEGGGAASILRGGNPALEMTHDAQVVVQYLRSRQAMEDVGAQLDLATIFTLPAHDFWSRLNQADPVEDRLEHWRRFVRPRFELTSGVVIIEVWAFRPSDALAIAQVSLAAAERLVNGISARARADALAFARQNAERTGMALAAARAQLAEFRNRHGVLSPQLAAGSVTAQEARLRDQIAEARAQLAVMQASFSNRSAPPLRLQAERVAALEAELATARLRMAASTEPVDALTLATLTSGHNALEADERIAQVAHERALGALSAAEGQAVQQSAYLDAFVRPALPERASYPMRWLLLAQLAFGGLVAWALGVLVMQALRDRAD